MPQLSTYQHLAQLIAARIYNQRTSEANPQRYRTFLRLLQQRGCADERAELEATVAEHVLALQVQQKLGSIGGGGPKASD